MLLSTLRPSHLLAGKVLGIGVVGLLQLTIQAGLGFALVLAVDAVDLPRKVRPPRSPGRSRGSSSATALQVTRVKLRQALRAG